MAMADTWQQPDSPVWETRSPYLVKTVLAQKKELETQTLQDKARLRLEADKQRKRALQLEQHYKQLQGLHKYQGTEMAAMKSALRKRDYDISELQERLSGLEESVLQGGPARYAERLGTLQAEHNELQEQMTRTLDQLHDAQQTARDAEGRQTEAETKLAQKEQKLEEKQRELEQATSDAEAERSRLSRARQKSEWKETLLEELIEALIAHRQQSIISLKDLLGPEGLGSDHHPAFEGDLQGNDKHRYERDERHAAVHCQRSAAGNTESAYDDEQKAERH